MLPMKNKILIVAPHLDDEVLGCGGTLIRHIEEKDEVCVAFIAHRVYGHKYDSDRMKVELSHMEKARKVTGYQRMEFFDLPDEKLDRHIPDIISALEPLVEDFRPDTVYSPFWQDNHQDHRAVAEAVRVVLRPAVYTFVKKWLACETPSSTEQSPPMPGCAFQPNCYVNISLFLERKLEAVRCYETEARPFPHPRSPEALKALAARRGVEAAMKYAEAFVILRHKR
jgi:LmbE family N-acetylglucosaminyl deacetylase